MQAERESTPALVPYSACLLCDGQDLAELVSRAEMRAAEDFRDQLYRRQLPREAPDSMLQDRTQFTHSYQARLVGCRGCGLIARDPRLAPSASVAEYSTDRYETDWMQASFESYRAGFRARMPELKQLIGPRARVLEVGSYVGGFLAAAREQGWNAQGIDVGRCVSDFARGQGLNVFTGTLKQAHLPDSSFDAVFLWVCFDELPRPWDALAEVRRVLAPGGWVMAQVPNGALVRLAHETARRVPPARARLWRMLAYDGLLGFPYQLGHTPATLYSMFSRAGLSAVEVRNRPHLELAGPAGPPGSAIPAETRSRRRTAWLADRLYALSGRRLLLAPWLEVRARRGP